MFIIKRVKKAKTKLSHHHVTESLEDDADVQFEGEEEIDLRKAGYIPILRKRVTETELSGDSLLKTNQSASGVTRSYPNPFLSTEYYNTRPSASSERSIAPNKAGFWPIERKNELKQTGVSAQESLSSTCEAAVSIRGYDLVRSSPVDESDDLPTPEEESLSSTCEAAVSIRGYDLVRIPLDNPSSSTFNFRSRR